MNKFKFVIKTIFIALLLIAISSFNNIRAEDEEEYPLDPEVTFSLKIVNSHNEDITSGEVSVNYGDYIFVKVIDNNGNELNNDLFTFEANDKLITYGFPKGKYLVGDEGLATLKVTLDNDPLAREATTSFNTIKGPIAKINFMQQSDQELWYVLEEIGSNQYKLDYNKVINNGNIEKDSTSGNTIQYLSFLCGYSKIDDTAPMLGHYPSQSEIDFVSSDSKVIKAYFKDIFDSGEALPIIEICGNGTATITVTYKNELNPKASITIAVENYPTKEVTKTTDNKDSASDKTNIENNSSSKVDDSTTDITNKQDIVDNKLEVSETKNKMSVICFIIPLTIGSVLIVLFFILGKNKKIFLIIGAITILLGLVAAGIYVVKKNKINKYNEAINLYLSDNNIEALTLLNEKDNEELYKDCQNRAFIEYLLLGNYDSAKALLTEDDVLVTFLNNYQDTEDSYDKYSALLVLVNELHLRTNYKYNELDELVTKEINNYLQDIINNSNVGSSFKFGLYDFKVIEKIGNTVYVIPDECLFSASIDSTWKDKTLACFNKYEQELLSKDDLLLLTRSDYVSK